ncbi:enoyl-CoA hydratase [Acinetobacter qingfengensis]|uniref:Enoyl-CoA hydratase n=1 Tax=Acinetobacter qingfengensis TaxID=1262585 RepID=A0A1E7RCD0_9GAMM|nr:enoyl-CoA hydratase [Acinetobacter qingfengensis]KAA8735121.1 enoyl-CoA hydratase [Acinetobacter qingfengensis]OEY97024.1 enoyl-CoA hydratase [Acinetobacter qingfengensis]
MVNVVRQDDGIAIVKINRPEAKNALNMQVRQELANIFKTLSFEHDIRSIVLTGNENCFVAGADVREFAHASSTEMYLRHTEYLWESISRCPKPVIAAVNGFALGGGCELAMHCDIIIAGDNARFGQPEVKLGLMPGAGGTQRLIRAVGKFQAMRMVLTGCFVSASEALQMGLVSEVVPASQTLDKAIQIATEIAAFSPLTVAQIKEIMLAGADLPLENALILERKAFQLLFDSHDQKEGAQAFLEKRTAHFKGH